MLVAVLVWACAHRVAGSRRMGELCGTGVVFRVICAGSTPDHVPVAGFGRAFAGVIGRFSAGVLALCARLGVGRPGVVTLGGMKIAASAPEAANRAEGTLARLAAGGGLFGAGGRGGGVPGGAWRPGRRDERIAAALAGLRAGRKAAEETQAARARAFRARRQAGQPTGRPPAAGAVELAEQNLARARAERAARLARPGTRYGGGQPPGPAAGTGDCCRVRRAQARPGKAVAAEAGRQAAPGAAPEPVRNITGPDSRLMPARGGGFAQGYHTPNVTSEDGLITAAGKHRDPEKAARSPDGAPPRAGPAQAAMACRLKTEDRIAACRQRSHIAQTPHGHIKHNMRIRQMPVGGTPKANAEWTFAAAVHNLFKAISGGHLTAQALPRTHPRPAGPPTATQATPT